MISDWHWFLILTNLISDDDSCNSRDLGDISKLKIKPKEKSSKKDEGKSTCTSLEPVVPVIAETFPLESETARESILSQPEIRQILRPRQPTYRNPAYNKSSLGTENSRRDWKYQNISDADSSIFVYLGWLLNISQLQRNIFEYKGLGVYNLMLFCSLTISWKIAINLNW